MPVIDIISKIGKQFHIVRRKIYHISLHLANDISHGMTAVLIRIFSAAKQSLHRVICRGVEQLLLIDIHVKSFVQIIMHRVQIKIYRAAYQHRLFGNPVVLQQNRQLPLRHAVICIHIRKFPAVRILVQQLSSNACYADHKDQYQCHNNRYDFLLHLIV